MHQHPHPQHPSHHPVAYSTHPQVPTPGHYDPRRLPPAPPPAMMAGHPHAMPHAVTYQPPTPSQRPPGLGVYVGQPVWTPEVPMMAGVEGPERSLMEWLMGDGVFPVGLKRLRG